MKNDFANPDSTECRLVQEALQRYMDGGNGDLSPELLTHRSVCPNCLSQYQAATLLRGAAKRVPCPSLGSAWTDAAVAAIWADTAARSQPRRAPWRVGAWLTIAAALLLAVGVWKPWQQHEIVREGTLARTSTPPLYVDKGLDEARTLVVDLTRRTADGAVPPTRNLIPAEVPASPLAVKDSLPRAVEPAAESLEEIRHGAASGLEPMANSARRAFAMFLNEVPALPPERKPDS